MPPVARPSIQPRHRVIRCRDREHHRDRWQVLGREVCKVVDSDRVWATPGWYTISCEPCGVAWRSNAKYAALLPDHPLVLTAAHLTPDKDARETAIEQTVEDHPLLAELTYWQHPSTLAAQRKFLRSVGEQFLQRGHLSPKQIDWAERIIAQHIAQETAVADHHASIRAAQIALGPAAAPEGFRVVYGCVERAWAPEEWQGNMPPTPKMLVRADEGFTVECTVPASIRRVAGIGEIEGRRVKLVATLQPKHHDLTSAWGRYPRPESQLLG